MPKVKGPPPINHDYRRNVQPPKPSDNNSEVNKVIIKNTSSSPSDVNSSRTGYDYGSYKRNSLELYYYGEGKGKKGKGWGKGGKRAAKEAAEEAIQEAIQKALEEQARLEELRQQEIKQEEIKYEQIQDDIKRDDIKDSEQDKTEKKDNHKKERLHTERHTPHETQRG